MVSARRCAGGQSCTQELALGLHRQQELRGTGIDPTPCAKRRSRIDLPGIEPRNCSLGAEREWELGREDTHGGTGRAALFRNESGTAVRGGWTLEFKGAGVTGSDEDAMRVTVQERRDATGEVSREYLAQPEFGNLWTRSARSAGKVTNEPAKKLSVTVSDAPCRTAGEQSPLPKLPFRSRSMRRHTGRSVSAGETRLGLSGSFGSIVGDRSRR